MTASVADLIEKLESELRAPYVIKTQPYAVLTLEQCRDILEALRRLTPEPALTLAQLRQLAEEYAKTLDGVYPVEYYATDQEHASSGLSQFLAWLEMSSGFAVRAAQPPGAGQG